MYLQKIKKNEFLSSFIIGTLLAFSVILYKNFFLGGFLYKNYESVKKIKEELDSFKGQYISEDIIKKILKMQSLTEEIKNG